MPERFPPALPFTALEYLTGLGRVHGLGRAAARSAAREWLDRFGIGEHTRTRLSELSKGTSQKVAVAQGLLSNPELLVLDEAWTGLDPASRTVLDDAVTARVAAGATVVFVDHDTRRLAGAPDAVFRVAQGRVSPVAGTGRTEPRVRVEAEGPSGAELPAGLPEGTVREPAAAPGAVRLTVAAASSDALLRALLTARPPWHIRAVTTVAPRGRAEPMTALLSYQTALLLRSHRWLPPLLLYAAFMFIGVRTGQPILDSFGYAAAALVPVTAWLVRVCVTNEPEAARDCAAAAAGPWRVHLSAVLTGLLASTVVGVAATAVVAAISEPRSSDHQVDVPVGEATAA
ncbi:hypothetical protein GCM10020000_18050 [Streptomyces olivoverticillatus]